MLGIDVASIENNTDPWVFAPIYEKARDSKTQKLVYEKNRKENLLWIWGLHKETG